MPHQFMHNSLICWWWDNWVMFQKSQSTVWFWLFWGLCAGSEHAVNFLHFVEVLVPEKELKDMDQDIIYLRSLWGGSKGPWLSFIYKHLFFFFSCLTCLFLCFITSQIKFVLQNLKRTWKLKFFYKMEVGAWEGLFPASSWRIMLGVKFPSLQTETPNLTYKVHELRPWKFFLQWLPFHSSGFIHLYLNHINKNILMNYASVCCSVVPNSLWPHGL